MSVPTVAPGLVRAQAKPRKGDSAGVRTGRTLRKLVGSSAAANVEAATRVARGLQQPITTGRQIVVTSIRGGAGKSTLTALLGRTCDHYRHDPVLMLEADPSLGTLPIRLGAPSVRWTCGDLARIIDPSMQLTDITGYLVQLPDGGWLLPGSQGTVGARLELPQYREVMVALRRYFGITVVDCESLPSELSRAALVAAQSRVLVAPATLEGVMSTRAILDWMAGVARPRMLPGTVVVLSSTSPHMTMDAEAAAGHLRLEGVQVLHLPYDRHLAAGGTIDTRLLGERTREAVARIAAELLNRRCCSTSRSPPNWAWARTACASAPPAPARASCCAPSCSRSSPRTRPRTWPWSSSTTRAAPPAPPSRTCRTSPASSPTWRTRPGSSNACTPASPARSSAGSGCSRTPTSRTTPREGKLPQLPSTDVVLLIDGFGSLRDDFEDLDDAVTDLLKRGGGYGIHVVAAMLRWNDVRIATQSTFGTRAELRLNDPSDSGIDRKLAETLAPDEPGRVLTDGKLFAQAALPRIDSLAATTGLGPAVEQAARSIRAAWPGDPAQQVRVLPPRVLVSSLPSPAAQPRRVPIGLDQTALAPVLLDLFERDQHLLVLGDSECGKSNLLRLVTQGLLERCSEEEIVFAVMNPRRGLRTLVPEEYRGGYAHNSRICGGLATGIAKELEKRLPDDLADQDAAADAAWYTGPRIVIVIVIVVDDYDILTTAGQQPLQPFLPFIPSAADIGLHFVVTRRVAGASRAMYDPFLTTLRESGTSALVMTGDRSEGQLFPGVYAGAQPPGRGLLVRRGKPNRLIQTALAAEGTS